MRVATTCKDNSFGEFYIWSAEFSRQSILISHDPHCVIFLYERL
jgi:hypothetical protein